MTRNFKISLGLMFSAVLIGCGGGGGDASPASAGTAEGFWTGTSSTGYQVAMAVLENGETWGIYTRGSTIYGALHGTSTGSGNSFVANGSDFNLVNWSISSGSYSGIVAQRQSINATSNRGTTIALEYDESYDAQPSLAQVAGSYSVSGVSAAGSASNAPMVITTDGAVSVTGMPGCTASGNVTPRASGKNVFNINMTFVGNNCALGNGGTASGIFVLDRSVTPNVALSLALTPNKQDGFIAVGRRN